MKNYQTFISCDELNERKKSYDVIVIDCRFDLSDPDWGYQDYLRGHIPGAIYANLDKDLSKPITPTSGRHPLPDLDIFRNTCAKWGINDRNQVVVYDTTSGSFAARLWWMLNYLEHANVAILNGGLSAWKERGLPVDIHEASTTSNFQQPALTRNLDTSILVTTQKMEEIISRNDFTLIDARAPERYFGKNEPIDKIAGRIPNAINFFHQDNLDENGYLLPESELQKKYDDLLEGKPKNTVIYCGSGVTSCMNVAVMKHLGFPIPKLYLGSWSEWIRDSNHPIVKD